MPRRFSMAKAKKHEATSAIMDIQRQGNCTNRNLGRYVQSGSVKRRVSSETM